MRSVGCLSAGETGEPHGHRRTHRPVTAVAAATMATAATASGRGLNLPEKDFGEGRFSPPEPASPRWG
jgi:hypothetical protein